MNIHNCYNIFHSCYVNELGLQKFTKLEQSMPNHTKSLILSYYLQYLVHASCKTLLSLMLEIVKSLEQVLCYDSIKLKNVVKFNVTLDHFAGPVTNISPHHKCFVRLKQLIAVLQIHI